MRNQRKLQPLRKKRTWKDANAVALLTIRKNCEDDVQARIGSIGSAKEAYEELKKAYEGKTSTEFYSLLNSISKIQFDDQTQTIEEYIAAFERTWNAFVGVIGRADLTATRDDGFGEGLQKFAKSDRAKSEFLLISLLSYYSNTVENIQAKDHGYDDAARMLKEYIPQKLEGRRPKADKGSKENPVVLKTEAGRV